MDARVAVLVAAVFAMGPEQLFFERMVMAETISLFALTLMLACGMEYLRKGNFAWLAGILALALLTFHHAVLSRRESRARGQIGEMPKTGGGAR